MKISVKHYDETLTIEVDKDDLTFYEYMDLIKRISVSIYSEKIVNDYWNG